VGSADGTFYAMNAKEGRIAWQLRLGQPIRTSAAIHKGIAYLAAPDGTLHGLGLEVHQSSPTHVLVDPSAPRPPAIGTSTTALYRGGLARTGVYPGALARPQAATQGWTRKTGAGVNTPPVLVGDVACFDVDRGRFTDVDSETFLHPKGRRSTTADGSTLVAVDRATGEERWALSLSSRLLSPLTTGDGRLFAGSPKGRLHAIDATTGKQLWQAKTGLHGGPVEWDRDGARPVRPHQPTFAAGVLYYANGDRLDAFDPAAGSVRWSAPLPFGASCSPAVSDELVIVGDFRGTLHAIDVATGRARWRIQTPPLVVARPAAGADVICVPHGHTLRGVDPRSGETRWSVDTGDLIVQPPHIVGDRVGFLCGGMLTALDASTGRPAWRFVAAGHLRHGLATSRSSVIAVTDTHAYVVDGTNGKLLSEHNVRYRVGTAPGADSGLFCIGGNNHNADAYPLAHTQGDWSFPCPDRVTSCPIVADGAVYFGSGKGKLHAVDLATHQARWTREMQEDEPIRSSVAVAGGLAFLTGKGYACGLEARTGRELWRIANRTYSRSNTPDFCSPVVIDGQVFLSGSRFTAIDGAAGTLTWRLRTCRGPLTAPAVNGGIAYVSCSDSHLHAIDLAKRQEAWTAEKVAQVVAPPVVSGNIVLCPEWDTLHALDSRTGQVVWKTTLGKGRLSAAAAAHGLAFVSTSKDRTLHALDLATGAAKWTLRPDKVGAGAPYPTAPSVVGDAVCYARGKTLYIVDARTGKVTGERSLPAVATTPPTIVDGAIYIGCVDR
ncbi:PQQ-binding-like beta-propeller repeat protein, partial [bacterium]|nr:PQQ-binding-like beta-propeller repeat protein [bacterium]